MSEPVYIDRGAMFDLDRRFRYRLWRVWDYTLPRVAFVMLNPSTADENKLDPTLHACLSFAMSWGCGAFEVGNLYALRSTDPAGLWKVVDPIGPTNDNHLIAIAKDATYGVVAAWGENAETTRADHVLAELARYAPIYHLGLTKGGRPKHPLARGKSRIPRGTAPTLWRSRRAA